MAEIATLETLRLRLRPFALADAPTIQQLASAAEIAAVTLHIPHPYPDGLAEQWIAGHPEAAQSGVGLTWAITDRASATLYGAIGIVIREQHQHAEMGYWIGVPFWGRGYCSEAAATVLAHGFGALGLHRILAHHFGGNPASGRVMQKIGMRYEGRQREHIRKGERFEDIVQYGILRQDWEPAST
ncbi:MAG: GNAT family N-acetyltransferase [Oscillochloris sp.]|nr:GNAT family N-acetyltransferase [Oscillochloris sp.]